jgi:alanyl-tRNA synthetase
VRARSSGRFEARRGSEAPWRAVTPGPGSEFVGYDRWTVEPVTIRDLREVEDGGDGRAVELTLDVTPFYAESGGQVADTGLLESVSGPAARLRIVDVYRDGDRIVHRAEVLEGAPRAGPWRATVDALKRAATQRNHTATHLLHAARWPRRTSTSSRRS